MVVLYACVFCACLVSAQPEEGIKLPGTGVTDGSDCHCGCWELLHPSSPSEQPLFLPTELSLALCRVSIKLTIKLAIYNYIIFI